jgi:hypothetical protein
VSQSQDLIEHIKNANNLIVRSKVELDRIHEVTKKLLTVHDELERDWEDAQQSK